MEWVGFQGRDAGRSLIFFGCNCCQQLKGEIEDVNRTGWQHQNVSKRRMLYGFACVKMTWLFFRNYYDGAEVHSGMLLLDFHVACTFPNPHPTWRPENKLTSREHVSDESEVGIPLIEEKTGTMAEWEELIREMFSALRALYDMQSPYIPKSLFGMLSSSLHALREASDGKLKLDRQRRRLLGS